MSNFLRQMAETSSARAEAAQASFTDDALDRPTYPLRLGAFDLIAEIKNRYPENTRVKAVVTNLTDYGCFAELEEGVEGLVHVFDG